MAALIRQSLCSFTLIALWLLATPELQAQNGPATERLRTSCGFLASKVGLTPTIRRVSSQILDARRALERNYRTEIKWWYRVKDEPNFWRALPVTEDLLARAPSSGIPLPKTPKIVINGQVYGWSDFYTAANAPDDADVSSYQAAAEKADELINRLQDPDNTFRTHRLGEAYVSDERLRGLLSISAADIRSLEPIDPNLMNRVLDSIYGLASMSMAGEIMPGSTLERAKRHVISLFFELSRNTDPESMSPQLEQLNPDTVFSKAGWAHYVRPQDFEFSDRASNLKPQVPASEAETADLPKSVYLQESTAQSKAHEVLDLLAMSDKPPLEILESIIQPVTKLYQLEREAESSLEFSWIAKWQIKNFLHENFYINLMDTEKADRLKAEDILYKLVEQLKAVDVDHFEQVRGSIAFWFDYLPNEGGSSF